jgi:hypothetical protein
VLAAVLPPDAEPLHDGHFISHGTSFKTTLSARCKGLPPQSLPTERACHFIRDMVETSEGPTLSDSDQGDYLEFPSKFQASRVWLADPTDVSSRLAPLFFIP